MQTREQYFANIVFALVEARRQRYANQQAAINKYGAMAHKLPVLIRAAGLAQALEFVATRPDQQKDLLDDLQKALDHEDLRKASREASLTEYMLLTEQALAALLWFKRYAESVLNVTSAAEDQV
ncbi:type III-B CRISPR module-associated protein Cmr5 [Kallotenue papyrolyticum]|uniref:type III-B CRISPR module-associated protein Cmr5 n=1 Tax=Kallotenue papyrolyticum TaxID=1325125 RepID=UPI0004926FE3|nr:type III-B CRISPR module-associated protein Cmr5 [Kallotenue papyrolyticum]